MRSLRLLAFAFAVFCGVAAFTPNLSDEELRKGVNVALTWKRLSFEQRREMVENLLAMPTFSRSLQQEVRVFSTISALQSLKMFAACARHHY